MTDIQLDQPSLDPSKTGPSISTSPGAGDSDSHIEASMDVNDLANGGALKYGVPKVATLTYFYQGAGFVPAYSNSPFGPQRIEWSGIARFAKPTYGDSVANNKGSLNLVDEFDCETLQPTIKRPLNREGPLLRIFRGSRMGVRV
ncbi:hypothetical protein I302_100953 [Kwoniella bestiolae CBS 10118]|uniref:Uncharacterized protein n=1 Tax=Kwoniella bestiolae CBS 10118 TaxID=1296100 RepID=A0A1B9G6H7_9TREE|nr:hypothetical protein I302_04330 [Kwoniella bestiolae CBS 10118]OCF26644.1 hypothetical protein I302_04330 [Kwoniella bestiolae CBS 10118]